MQTKNTAKTTSNKTAKVAAPALAPVAVAVAAPALAPVVKAMAQWCNTNSTKRQFGHPASTPCKAGTPNTAKPGSARHTALQALQACTTVGQCYNVAATNWVHWAIAQGYIVVG